MSVCEIKIKTFIPSATLRHPVGVSKFDGDNRGFSYDGSYRTAHYIKIDLDDLEILTNMVATGQTCETTPEKTVLTEYGLETTPERRRCGQAGTDGIKLENIRTENGILHFTAVGAAGNPLVLGAPDIDYQIYVSVRKNGRVCITGGHDGFPNYEVWARVNYGTPENVYSYSHGSNDAGALFPPMDQDIATGTCT